MKDTSVKVYTLRLYRSKAGIEQYRVYVDDTLLYASKVLGEAYKVFNLEIEKETE